MADDPTRQRETTFGHPLCRSRAWVLILAESAAAGAQEDPHILFAVVTAGGAVTEAALIASEPVLDNPMWKKLEICAPLRVEA